MVELAVTVALIGALAAIGFAFYQNARLEAQDTKAREALESVANQASARLLADRNYTYASYGTSTALAQSIFGDDPTFSLVPLGEELEGEVFESVTDYVASKGNHEAVGVIIDENGAAVFSVLSESGRCWLLRHDPAGATSNAGMVYAQGNPDQCGVVAAWAGSEDGNQPPVALSDTYFVAPGGNLFLNLSDYASDPDGGPSALTFQVLPSSVLPDAMDLNDLNNISWMAPKDMGNTNFILDYSVSDGEASAMGRITIAVGNLAPGQLEITLDCPDFAPYGAYADCEVNVESGAPVGYTWEAPMAAPFDCEDDISCALTRERPGGTVEVTVVARDASGAESEASDHVTFQGRAPVVNLTCDTDVSYTQVAYCYANASDPNNEPLSYIWTLDSSKSPVGLHPDYQTCASSASCPLRIETPANPADLPAIIDVFLLVSDGVEDPTPARAQVQFVNLPPSAPVITCEPSVSHTVGVMNCVVTDSVDPEGGPVSYTWAILSNNTYDLNHTPSPDSCAGRSCSFSHQNPVDTLTVKVVATDELGATTTDDAKVRFVNTPPEITSVVCSSPHPYQTETTNCVANLANDPEGDDASYEFSWMQTPAGSASPATCVGSNECEFTRTTPGSVTATVTVTDRWGGKASRPGTAVFINVEPQFVLTCDRTQTNKAGSPQITCTAREVGGLNPGPFSYDFSPSDDELGLDSQGGACNGTQCAVLVTPTGDTGVFTPRVEVTDNFGASVEVTGPELTVFDAEPTITLSGCSVATSNWCRVTARVSDPDDATAQVDWPAAGEGGVPAGTGRQACTDPVSVTANGVASVTCDYRRSAPGSHTITVGATSGGKSTSGQATITFTNQLPTITLSIVGNTSVSNCNYSNSNVSYRQCRIRATVSDAEHNTLTVNFPNIPGLTRSGSCSNVQLTYSGSPVSAECTYRWEPAAAQRRQPPVTRSSTYDDFANVLNYQVTVTDSHGGTRSVNTNTASNSYNPQFRFRSIPNLEAPTVTITCNGISSGTLNVAANATVTCTKSHSDPDGISHWYWNPVSGSAANHCDDSVTCVMSAEGTSATVRLHVRDHYCKPKPECGNADGSRVGFSDTITINWAPAPPAGGGGGGGGCGPAASLAATASYAATNYTSSAGRKWQVFGVGAEMVHRCGATRNVTLNSHSVSGAASGFPSPGSASGNFTTLLAHNGHKSGTRICQSATCAGAHMMFVYFRVRQECQKDTTVYLTVQGKDGQYTKTATRTVTVEADTNQCGTAVPVF